MIGITRPSPPTSFLRCPFFPAINKATKDDLNWSYLFRPVIATFQPITFGLNHVADDDVVHGAFSTFFAGVLSDTPPGARIISIRFKLCPHDMEMTHAPGITISQMHQTIVQNHCLAGVST